MSEADDIDRVTPRPGASAYNPSQHLGEAISDDVQAWQSIGPYVLRWRDSHGQRWVAQISRRDARVSDVLLRLLARVAERHGFGLEDLQAHSRSSSLFRARREAAKEARAEGWATGDIGRAMHRHWSTISALCREPNGD